MRRPYDSVQWRDVIRPAVIARDKGVCQWPGCMDPGSDVDHKIPWREAPWLAFEMSNLRLLCEYHNRARPHTPANVGDGARRASRDWFDV